MNSSSTATNIFREKERLLRRGFPVQESNASGMSSRTSPRGLVEPRTPSTTSTIVPPLLKNSSATDGRTSTGDIPQTPSDHHRHPLKHVPIPRLHYYDNLRDDEVEPGSRARLHLAPYGQKVPAMLSPTSFAAFSSPKAHDNVGGRSLHRKTPPPQHPTSTSTTEGRHYPQSCQTSQNDAVLFPRQQGCAITTRLLPAGTPYRSANVSGAGKGGTPIPPSSHHLEQGLYHNVYYNTSYRIPENLTCRYRRRPPPSIPKKKVSHMEHQKKQSPLVSSGTSLDADEFAPTSRSPVEEAYRAKLSWHLIDPFFPDFGRQCLSDEDLVRDLAERLRSLIEQQQQPSGDYAKDLLVPGRQNMYPLQSIPDAGQLFGLNDAEDVFPPTALQDAITAAFVEVSTLNEAFERVSAETGLAYNPVVLQPTPDFVQVYHRPSLSPQRHFVSNGSSMDVLPMLRYQSPGCLVSEKFIFSHGSYLRLTASILLSRFTRLYQIREVLLEGTGNVFPLFPVFDIGQCHASRELDAFIKWSVRSTLEERMVRDYNFAQAQHAKEMLHSSSGNAQEDSEVKQAGESPSFHPPVPLPSPPSPEEYCVQLYDCNNFDCLPAAVWLGHTVGTVQDHVTRCMEDCLDNPSGEERFYRQRSRKEENSSRQRILASRRRLFLGTVPSREMVGTWYRLGCKESLSEPERLLLEDTFSLAYAYMYTAQQYNISGGEGSMMYSVLCDRLPEVALYDCLILIEKLRLALRHSHLHPTARNGIGIRGIYEAILAQHQTVLEDARREEEKANKRNRKVKAARDIPESARMQPSPSPPVEPVLWSSDLLREQYRLPDATGRRSSLGDAKEAEAAPTLHSVAVMLFEFFPGKKMADLELLCRAVVQDTIALGGLVRFVVPTEEEDGSKAKNDILFINEVARAMMAVILEQDAQRRYRSQQNDQDFHTLDNQGGSPPPPPPPLVFDDEIVPILSTPVAVDTLFQYHSVFFDHSGEVWRKSNLVECVRMLYTAEVFQYASDMQVAILSAECRSYQQIPPECLAVECCPKPWSPQMQRSFLRLRHLPIKFSTPTTGVASVRAVLQAVQQADPLKTDAEAQEYVHHLLILYFRDHLFPVHHPQYPGDRESHLPEKLEHLLDAVTWMNWFDGPSSFALCDTIYVDLYAIAALCPLVLGRRVILYAGDTCLDSSASQTSTQSRTTANVAPESTPHSTASGSRLTSASSQQVPLTRTSKKCACCGGNGEESRNND